MGLHRIDLNRLQIFRAIVLSGSMTKAAHQLRQPKSRISRHLASLEKELGAQLIYRSTRGLQLTPAGQELVQNAVPHLSSLENALERVSQTTEEISGRIRVSVPEDIGAQIMGKICHSFLALYPNVFLEIHVSNQQMDLIRESFDVALRIGKLKDSTLIQKKIGVLPLVPYISPELRAKHGAIATPADLGKIPFLAFSAVNESLRYRRGNEPRSVKIKPIFISNSFFVLRDLAVQGHGFTAMPPFVAEEALARGQLVPALRDWTPEGTPAQIILPNQKEIPVRTRKFIEHLRSQIAPFTS